MGNLNRSASTYKIAGLDDLVKVLRSLRARLRHSSIEGAIAAACGPMVEACKQLCPTDSGHLRETIQLDIRRTKSGGYSAVVVAGEDGATRLLYLGTIEFGNRTRAAQPFMRPGFDQHKDSIAAKLAQLMADQVTDILKSS